MNALGARLAFVALFVVPATLRGAEPAYTTKSLLASWQRASRQVQIIDSKFVRFTNDWTSHTEERESGRFYCELPDRRCYQLDEKCQFIWNGEVTFVEPDVKSYRKWSVAEVAQARIRLRQLDALTGFQRLWNCGEAIEASLATCEVEDVLPLVTTIDADAVQKRYDLTWKEEEGKITLTAVPKEAHESKRIREIAVILDRGTFAVLAHRVIDRHGREVVHVFENTTFNVPATDRARLLAPDLNGFRNIRVLFTGQ